MKHLLRLMMITAVFVFAALKCTRAQLPELYNTGNPAFVRLVDPQWIDAGSGVAVDVDPSDTLVAYFTHEGNHMAGVTALRSSGTHTFVVFGRETGPGSPKQLTGVPSGDDFYLALKRGEAIYPVQADSVMLYNLFTGTEQPGELRWMGFAFYNVYRLQIDFTRQLELVRVPWLIFRDQQCPAFTVGYNQTIEQDFTMNYLQQNHVERSDGSEWERIFLANHRRMEIRIPRPAFSPGQYVQIEQGSGRVVEGKWKRYYYFGKQDYDRGHVVLRWFSGRYPGCALDRDPSVLVRFNLRSLPEPVQEWTMVKPPDPDPGLELVPVDVDYDSVLAQNAYIKIVVIDGIVHAINHLNKSATIRFREKGAPRYIMSFALRSGAYRASSIHINSPRFKGKQIEVQWSSWRLKLDGELIFQL
jgi:hypothetical protein